MNSVEKIIFKLILSIVVVFGVGACTPTPDPGNEPGSGQGGDIVTEVTTETNMMLTLGSEQNIRAKGAEMTDVLILEGPATHRCEITKVSATWFKFRVPTKMTDGSYKFIIERGERTQTLFTAKVTIQNMSMVVPNKPASEKYTLKGKVYCGTEGVKDVLVTDGVIFTKTDADGNYWLKSDKRYELVYVVQPYGYEVLTQQALPQFWKTTSTELIYDNQEQHNFELKKVNNDNNRVLVATDIHLANRKLTPLDLTQFHEGFVNELISEYTGRQNVYCLNLGDFAFDAYWYNYNFDIEDAAATVSSLPLTYWSTMGNHDNDGRTPAGADMDFRASEPYRRILGPTHIAFNIGKVHYILIDDICYVNNFPSSTADPLMGQRDYYAGFRNDMIEWVKADLSYVDKNTPIVVGMHSPLSNASGSSYNGEFRYDNWKKFVDLFKEFREVEFIAGHTHQSRMRPMPGYGTNLYEHNIGAVCGVWWNTSQYSGGTINKPGALCLCPDGTPSGYFVYDVQGTQRQWFWKSIGEPENKQFKSFDMNEVKKFFDSYGLASKFIKAGSFVDTAYGNEKQTTINPTSYGYNEEPNTIWINVWGYENGPFAHYGNWEITVTENGKPLTVEQINFNRRDPLAALTYDIPKYNETQGRFSASSMSSVNHNHMFRAVATSATSTVTIKVKDRFGKVYVETMTRPKKFYTGNISDSWTLE